MNIPFYKYQGTGNDFILIDNREQKYLNRSHQAQIQWLCDRRFGIGADGLILLQEKEGFDFEMVYFNADGAESTMCGNGGRCISAFAKHLGMVEGKAHFLAIDGPHDALFREDGWVELKMMNVSGVEFNEDHYVLNTGSPHYVAFVEDVDDIDVVQNGQAIRYSKKYRKDGINVNFVEKQKDKIFVLTYERGVEGETLSCGTGVTAAAIAYFLDQKDSSIRHVPIQTKGGGLEVSIEAATQQGDAFHNIWLCGPAQLVFNGEVNIAVEAIP